MISEKIEKQLPRRVRRFIDEHGLLEEPCPLVVGVSGGADSVCLLYILFALRDELGLDLHVAHLNHQLRGAESDADADYVLGLAQRLGIPATVEKRDVAAYQVWHRCSLEEAAREVRYAFFAEVAQSLGARIVAVGHTRDDQAETMLMHLIRGTGLGGLRGMLPLTQWHLTGSARLMVIRPLLEVSREETESYCATCDLSPRVDSTNISSKHLRNRIRSELVPLLQDYNPGIRESLFRAARLIADDVAHLDAEVLQLWGSVVENSPGGVTLDNKAFAELSPALKRHLLRSVMERLRGNLRDIEMVHIESIAEIMTHPAGRELSLPDGMRFYGDYRKSFIVRGDNPLALLPPIEGEHRLSVPGRTTFPGWRVEAEILDHRPEILAGDDFVACFDSGLVGEDLLVRARHDGDRFQPLGMDDSKKLQDFMVDSKIPRVWRDRIPLVCSGDRILWVVGWRIDHRVRVTDATGRVLRLVFEEV